MHKNGFIHRDLKPENLLVFKNDQSYVVKICDFTWTLELEEKLDGMEERKTFCGTFEYMAPEMLNEETHNYQIDVWSLGILLFELVHGYAPFRGTNQMTVKSNIKKKLLKIPFKEGLSDQYKDLVYKFLNSDCNQRIPLIKVFEHPWVKKLEEQALAERGEDSSSSDDEEDDESSSSDGEYDDESDYEQESDSPPESVNEDSDDGQKRDTSYIEGDSSYIAEIQARTK